MTRLALWFMTILVVLCCSTTVLANWPCKYHVGSKLYNFSKLEHITGSAEVGPVFLSLCEPLIECDNALICQPRSTDMGSSDKIYASAKSTPAPVAVKLASGNGISITFNNGSASCQSGMSMIPFITQVNVQCSKTKSTNFALADGGDCVRIIDIEHPTGCGSDGDDGLSGGAVFLIIVLSLWAAYFIFGFLLCKFYLKKETVKDSIPHFGFWTSLPGFYVAGIKFAIAKVKGNKNSMASSDDDGYGAVEEV